MFTVQKALLFLPAILVLPVWLTIGLRDGLLVNCFRDYYSLSIAMVFGSIIAGSTPLGGGVVAFPVSVLVVGFSPSQGRDFSLLIQSVGMTAASYLIMIKKPNLIEKHGILLANALFFGLMGLIVGFLTTISPFVVMCIYTILLVAFAIVLAYVETFLQKQENMTFSLGKEESMIHVVDSPGQSDSDKDEVDEKMLLSGNIGNDVENSRNEEVNEQEPSTCIRKRMAFLLNSITFVIFCFCGGFVSSQIGTGMDIACYAYCALIHNARNDVRKISDNDLTALSVIVMAGISVFGSTLRVSTPGIDAVTAEAYQALMACACIVLFGAPVGSLFLSKNNQRKLKLVFYFLAPVQLASFGIIKIKTDIVAWLLVGGILSVICVAILIADAFVFQTEMGAKTLVCCSN